MVGIHKRVHNAGAVAAPGRIVDGMGSVYITLSVRGSTGISAGAVQLEGSPVGGTVDEDWVAIGAPLAASADATVKQTAIEGHRFLRARISTAIVGGTVDVYITIGGPRHGGWDEEGE